MDAATRKFVRYRAEGRCEYCRLPQSAQPFLTFHVEHVRPSKHDGPDDAGNLCVACARCNLCKGSNLSGIDPETGSIELLFNPRRQNWEEHFDFRGPVIVGLTSIGRTTVKVLGMNEERRVQLRADLIARGELFD